MITQQHRSPLEVIDNLFQNETVIYVVIYFFPAIFSYTDIEIKYVELNLTRIVIMLNMHV